MGLCASRTTENGSHSPTPPTNLHFLNLLGGNTYCWHRLEGTNILSTERSVSSSDLALSGGGAKVPFVF